MDVLQTDSEIINYMKNNNLFIDGKFYRKVNNDVKNYILRTSMRSCKNLILLDLACGRGGDLGKWQNIDKYAKVVGVDICEKSVNEAIHRYHNVYRKKDKRMKVFFIKNIDLTEQSAMHDISRILNKRRLTPFGNFNIVSCQMSLNHFLESEVILLNIFEITSKALMKGGIACFSFLNGHKILDLLGTDNVYVNRGIYIEKLFTEEPSERRWNDYGMMYKIFIADSNNVESYFQVTGVNREFLTFPETIDKLIKENRQLRLRFWEKRFCSFGKEYISDLFSYFLLEKY